MRSSKRVPLRLLALLALFAGCESPEPYDPQDARKRISYMERALEISTRENGRRQWEWFRGGKLDTSPVPGGKLPFFDHAWFHRWRGRIPDPMLDRKARLIHGLTLEAQFAEDPVIRKFSSGVIERLNAYRPVVDGKRMRVAEAKQRLSTEPDARRRELVWRALHVESGRSVLEDVGRIIARRNKVARGLGYRNFYEACLDANGLDAGHAGKLLAELEKRTRNPYRRLYGATDLEAWDLAHLNHSYRDRLEPFLDSEQLVERVRATLVDTGLGLFLEKIAVDQEDRPGRSSHFFSFPVEIPGDVRILITPGPGLDPLRFTFHEFGHALYYRAVQQPAFIFRLPGSSAYSEGLAKTLERIPYQRGWLTAYAGVPEETAGTIRDFNRRDELVKIRHFLANAAFERGLYENPSVEPGSLYWRTVSRIQGVEPVADAPAWASDIHLVSQPLSNLWYIYARLIQAQIHRGLDQRFGAAFGTQNVGQFLVEAFYRHGASRPWQDLLRDATGKPLSSEAYLEDELRLTPVEAIR